MRRLQGITTLLHELMPNIHIPHMGQTNTGGEHQRSPEIPPRTTRQGLRTGTPWPNNQVPKITNLRRESDRREGKAPMYKETTENTYSRAPYVPPPCKKEAEQKTLKASNIKRLIKWC